MATLLPEGKQHFENAAGAPLVGGRLYTYDAGTNNPRVTYQDAAQTTPNTNPIILDARGEATIFWNGAYKVVLRDALDNIIWTVDFIQDANAAAAAYDAAIRADLLSVVNIAKGAGMSGYAASLLYAAGTVGAKLRERRSVEDYGAVGDNVVDDTNAFIAATIALLAVGGGILQCAYGKTYKLTGTITLDNVWLDLNQSTINYAFPNLSDIVGFDMCDHSAIFNGTVDGNEAGAPLSANKEYHCPVVCGRSGASLAGFTDVHLRALTVTTNRSGVIGGRGILIQSASNNVTIEDIDFPDSVAMGTCVQVSWAGPGGSPPATSQHPYNIEIRNIRFGTMTKVGEAFDVVAIDIVGCYNTIVENVRGVRWAGDAVVQVRPGGFGNTVAPANIKPLLFRNITVKNVACEQVDNSMVIVNGRANNAVGTPVMSIPCRIENCKGKGLGLTSTGYGVRVIAVYDVEVVDCEMESFDRGCFIEEDTKRIKVHGGRYFNNNESGVVAVHGTIPEDIWIDGVEAYLNGQDGTSQAGIYIEACRRVKVTNCILGDITSETTQSQGIKVISSTGAKVLNNHARGVKAGGSCWAIGSSATDYGILDAFHGNTVSDVVRDSEVYAGVNIIAESCTVDPATGLLLRNCFSQNGNVPPSAGTWRRGEKIWHTDQSASTSMGEVCVSSGTFSAFSDVTGDTTNGSNVITGMTSTVGLAAGDFVTLSAGFASTGPHRVLATTANSITMTVNANATVANITVSTPDPVFKAMPALAA